MRTLRVWIWSIAIWTAFGVINGTQVVVGMRAQGMHHPWTRLFITQALSWALWAVASPLVLALGKRFPPERFWPVHLAAYSLIGLVDATWFVSLHVVLQPMGMPDYEFTIVDTVFSFFYSRFHLDLIAYAGVLILGHTIESQKTIAERDAELAKARLEALRRQLEPHFLFNTLNGIAGLVRSGDNNTAVDMIAGLSHLLRRVIDGPVGLETSLADEIEFVQKYLVLQRMRFASRLAVDVDIPLDLSTARVPSMILQPIVENAIKHGISTTVDGGSIRISARRVNRLLRMSVENSGPAIATTREGVGITNTRARLKSMYGDEARFEIRNNTAAGLVEAVVSVPYRSNR